MQISFNDKSGKCIKLGQNTSNRAKNKNKIQKYEGGEKKKEKTKPKTGIPTSTEKSLCLYHSPKFKVKYNILIEIKLYISSPILSSKY